MRGLLAGASLSLQVWQGWGKGVTVWAVRMSVYVECAWPVCCSGKFVLCSF